MKKEVATSQEVQFKINVPNIGVGRMVTTSTYIIMILAMLESNKYSQVSVLSSVIEHLGIDPDDLVIEKEDSEGRRKDLNYQRRKYSWEQE